MTCGNLFIKSESTGGSSVLGAFTASTCRGGAVDYDFVVLTEFPDFASLENSRFPELFSEVQGMDDYEAVLKKTNDARTRVRNDVWVLVENTE